MIRISFLVLILLGCSSMVHSQALEIGVWSGMGTYDLSSLRKIQPQPFNQNSFPKLYTPDSHTIHSNYGVALRKVYSNFSVGSFFRYEFSGNQKAYYNLTKKNYYNKSGTNIVYGISSRFHLKKQEFKNIEYFPYYSLKLGRAHSTFDYTYSETGNSQNTNSGKIFDLSSSAFIIEPGIGIRAYNGFVKIDPAVSLYIPFLQSDYKINGETELVNPSDEIRKQPIFLAYGLGSH